MQTLGRYSEKMPSIMKSWGITKYGKLQCLNALSASPTKWPNILKHHFVGLALNGLTLKVDPKIHFL